MCDPRFALAVRRGMAFRATFSRKSAALVGARVVCVIAVYAIATSYGAPFWLCFAILVPTTWIVGRVWPIRFEDTLSPRLATHWLGIGLCPCCLYGLAEIPAADEGVVVCPECGAAWRRDRVQGSGRFESVSSGLARGVATARAYSAMFQQGVFVKDAKGDRVPMAVTALGDRLQETEDPDLLQRLRQGVRVIRGSGRGARWLVAGFFAALGIAEAALFLSIGPMPISLLPRLVMVLFPFLMSAGVFWGDFGYKDRRIARRLVALRLCPSCGGDLKGCDAVEGVVSCGCGAAWKVDSD